MSKFYRFKHKIFIQSSGTRRYLFDITLVIYTKKISKNQLGSLND
jgi:hypothetical protein